MEDILIEATRREESFPVSKRYADDPTVALNIAMETIIEWQDQGICGKVVLKDSRAQSYTYATINFTITDKGREVLSLPVDERTPVQPTRVETQARGLPVDNISREAVMNNYHGAD